MRTSTDTAMDLAVNIFGQGTNPDWMLSQHEMLCVAAISDALDQARREGAEEMRERAAKACRQESVLYLANARKCDKAGNHHGGTVDTASAAGCAFCEERIRALTLDEAGAATQREASPVTYYPVGSEPGYEHGLTPTPASSKDESKPTSDMSPLEFIDEIERNGSSPEFVALLRKDIAGAQPPQERPVCGTCEGGTWVCGDCGLADTPTSPNVHADCDEHFEDVPCPDCSATEAGR